MEILLFLILLIILIILISIQGKMDKRMGGLEHELREMNDQMRRLNRPPQTEPAPRPKPTESTIWERPKPPVPIEQPTMEEPVTTPPKPKMEEEKTAPTEMVPRTQPARTVTPITMRQTAPRVKKPSFFERYPDLEKFIGENLISKIGIAILVIAIGFFVKYAIDQNWIGAIGRVGIGILCGAVLLGVAHRLRNSYRAFSSVLTGGGLAVLYFTITLAFQQFHLLSQTATFIIMVVITAFAVALSLLYDKQELAIIALVGGFATPFMASNGSGNYMALFTYLLILNTGLLVIAYNKTWRLLNLLAFLFTVVLFGSWLFTLGDGPPNVYLHGLWFATAFYVLFFVINMANNIKENKQFIGSDFGILLANTALYFTVALYCINEAGLDRYRGLLSASLAVFHLIISFLLYRNKKVDANVLYLLIGLALTFVSITGPIQLKGNHITLFWASEMVVLYWLYQKSRIQLVQLSSLIVWVAMMLSLFLDWNHIYIQDMYHSDFYISGNRVALPIIFNKGFLTGLYASLATFALFWLRKKDAPAQKDAMIVGMPHAVIFCALSIVLLFVSGLLEIDYQIQDPITGKLYMVLYTFAFVLLVLAILPKEIAKVQKGLLKPLLLVGCLALYLIQSIGINHVQMEATIAHPQTAVHFIAHWIAAVLVAVCLMQTALYVKNNAEKMEFTLPASTWLLCFAIVTYISVEAHLVVNSALVKTIADQEPVHTQFVKIGLPILWGLCSFGFMWTGMRYKFQPLRIVSLALFAITLIKLFAFDIRNISEGGKIAAFFCLGVLLLVVSFMYQRLKKIILDDERKRQTGFGTTE